MQSASRIKHQRRIDSHESLTVSWCCKVRISGNKAVITATHGGIYKQWSMAMENDKVLALAREAGLAVTISSHDSLHKFAALIRQQMEAENVCICGYTYAQHTYDKNCDSHGVCPNRQGVFRNERQHELIQKLDAENAELRKDAERYRWLRKNPEYIGFDYDMLDTQVDEAIDRARSANDGN